MNETAPSHFLVAIRQMRQQFPIVLPMLAMAIFTLILRVTPWEIQLSEVYFNRPVGNWPLSHDALWDFVDLYFIYPGFLLGIGSVAGILCFVNRNINTPAKRAAMLIGCSFLIGPGLLVNGSMKPIFSRPRPREVQEFGGQEVYRHAFGFGRQWHFNSSFPSGHAAIGYFLITPAFLFTQRRSLRLGFLCFGLIYGSLMSYSRIVQGGHFLSDVVWSLAIIYFSGWLMATLILRKQILKQSAGSADDSNLSVPLKSAA